MYAMSWISATLDSCRSLSFSENGVDYDKFTITSHKTLADALTYWVAQANASSVLALSDYAFSINTTTGAITISAGGAFVLKFHGNLEQLLGFEPNAVTKVLAAPSNTVTSTTTVMGILVTGAGFEAPKPMESAKLESLRHGRSQAFIHNHGQYVRAWFYMSRTDFDAYNDGPMMSGKFRLYHTSTVTAYSATNTDGYVDLYPFGRPLLQTRGRDESLVRVELDCMYDDGFTIPVPEAPSYAAIGSCLPFGWSIVYALQIEGIVALFTELKLTGTAPTNTTQRCALVVDTSAKVGSVADRRKGIAKAFDLTVGLIDTDPTDGSAVRGFFARPTAFCALSADLAYNGTTINVDDTTDFDASDLVYIGNETINHTGKTGTTLTGLTRSYAGSKAYNHSARSDVSVWVSDNPFTWIGREATLYAIPIDPFKSIPHDITEAATALLASAPVVFRGYIGSQPMRVDERWQFTCKPMVRRLDDEIIAAPTGKAKWGLDDDLKVKADTVGTLSISYNAVISATHHNTFFTVQPFAALNASTLYTLKQLRSYLASQLDTLFSSAASYPDSAAPRLSGFKWVDEYMNDEKTGMTFKKSRLVCTVTSHSDDLNSFTVWMWGGTGNNAIPWLFGGPPDDVGTFLQDQVSPLPDDTETAFYKTVLTAHSSLNAGFLNVSIDEGIADEIPSSGYVIVDGDTSSGVYKYSATANNSDGTVSVYLGANSGVDLAAISKGLVKGDASDVTVSFAYADEGSYHDLMLRMIMSSGKSGVNDSTYDANIIDQGYDIAHVNKDTFADVLDGPIWSTLGGKMLYESGDGFGAFAGLLALSQRSIVENERGGDLKLEMIHASFADSGTYKRTIYNHHLVTNKSGREPIRPMKVKTLPNFIEVTTVESEATKKQKVVARDVQKMRTQGTEKMSLKVKGMTRGQLIAIFYDFAYSWFAVGNGRPQAVQVDIHPSIDIKIGDPIFMQLATHHLWQYGSSTQHRGYNGMARVIGKQTNLTTSVVTLTLMLDGVLKSLALSPSAKVLAFAGAGSAPTEISVDKKYYDVFNLWGTGVSTFKVLAYKPGQDGVSYAYNVSTVTLDGDYCKLTIDSQVGTFTVAAGWYLTNAVTGDSNTNQTYYAHTNTDGVWI